MRGLGADDHFGAGFQFSDEIPLNFGVGIRVIVNVPLMLHAVFAEILLALTGREGVETTGLGDTAVAQSLNDDRGLLLVGQSCPLSNEVLRVLFGLLGHRASMPLKIPATVFRASWCFPRSSPTSAS